jgi:hypothetical protein
MLDSPKGVCSGQTWSEYPATSVLFSLNPPMSPLRLLVCPGRRAISADEAVHLLDAAPYDRQKASDLRGQRGARKRSVDPGLVTHGHGEHAASERCR